MIQYFWSLYNSALCSVWLDPDGEQYSLYEHINPRQETGKPADQESWEITVQKYLQSH